MDVIVLDVALPRGLEGLRFLDWYYGDAEHRAKVIVLSASGREILDEVRQEPRVAEVMSKPFAVENLVAVVEGLLNR